MKLYEFLEAQGLHLEVDVPDREIVIETDKQLLPNASYDFEVDADAHRIVLRPTIRK